MAIIYPLKKQTNRALRVLLPLTALIAAGCGNINPNFSTIVWRDAAEYTIEGALSTGFASRAKVGYIHSEGDNPDLGSFEIKGRTGAGILSNGVYSPSDLVTVDGNRRWHKTFKTSRRFALIKLFAWDDTNNNNIKDYNEPVPIEWVLKKEDQRGWSYNAPDWNQFNFTFVQ
jgi:hypothetical protein